MLNTHDLQDAVETITYKTGFSLNVMEPDLLQGPYLFILINQPNAYDQGATEVQLRIHSPIPPMKDYEAFFDWVLWRLKMVEIHECMEFFRVDGKIYLDPHKPM